MTATIVAARGEQGRIPANEIVEFLSRHGHLNDEAARRWLSELACLAVEDGRVVGASAARPATLALIGGRPFWIHQCILARDSGVGWDEMFNAAFELLTMEYERGDAPYVGVCVLVDDPEVIKDRPEAVWPKTELMVGSDVPLISPLNPLSLASVGSPDFSAAGNLWNWLGQLRLTREIASLGSGSHEVRWTVTGAVMEPYASQLAANEPDAVDAGERSERPAFEARLNAQWLGASGSSATVSEALIAESGGEIGIGMHRSWVATSAGTLVESHAVSLDAHAVVLPHVELRGEAYTGRLLRGLGGGGIAQNFGAPPVGAPVGAFGPPIRDAAGWAQLNVQPHTTLIAGIGCGVDVTNPDDGATRLQNTACAAHADWRPAQPLVFGVEYRQLGTRYSSGTYGARHLNLIFGVEL